MKQYQFIVPDVRNSDKGMNPPAAYKELASHLLDVAGGFTTDRVIGYWKDDSGKVITDYSLRYTVAIEDSDFGLLYDIAVDCLKMFDQQCIYFVHPDGTAELIYP